MFFVHDFRYKSIEEVKCRRGCIYVAREHNANAARLIITLSKIVVLYYNNTLREKAEYIDEDDIVQQNYSICLPSDITIKEIVSLMDTEVWSDGQPYYVFDCCFTILAAMNVMLENPAEEKKELIVSQQCDILQAIDDFFGLRLEAQGCNHDWEYNIDHNPLPRRVSRTAEIRAKAAAGKAKTAPPKPLPDTRQEVGEREQRGPRPM